MLFIDIRNDENLYTVRYLTGSNKEIESGVIDIDKDIKEQEFFYKLFLETTNDEVYMWNVESAKKLNKIGSLSEKDFQIDEIFLVESLENQIKKLNEIEMLNDVKTKEIPSGLDILLHMKEVVGIDTKMLFEAYKALEAGKFVADYLEKFNNSAENASEMVNGIYNSMIYYYNELHNSSLYKENRITYKMLSLLNEQDNDEDNLEAVEIPF